MKILLLGEYSNVHATLAKGLRALGHQVTVASDGDSWKGYKRDINLYRAPGFWGLVCYSCRLLLALPRLTGYDVVQVINPMFLELKAERVMSIYRYLFRRNRHVVMGAYGMDHYWVKVNTEECPMEYSDFNIGKQLRHDDDAEQARTEWMTTYKASLTRHVANTCDAIVAGLYEYWVTYSVAEHGRLQKKTRYIPFPIEPVEQMQHDALLDETGKLLRPIRIFVGVSRNRSSYKGTDIMLAAARQLQQCYPDRVELQVAEGIPFAQYQAMMEQSDMILDQLYSYTPAMNALLAMSKGIVNVGGGEEPHYELLGEPELRPIVNVKPSQQSVYDALEQIVLHPDQLIEMKRQSIEYVRKHHDYLSVAAQYIGLYKEIVRADNMPLFA